MKYSAEDFENAKFAELVKYGLRAHKSAGDSYWQRDGIKRATNEEMADAGWVPVSTAPQIAENALGELYVAAQKMDGGVAIREAARSLGIEVVPDAGPADAEILREHLFRIVEDKRLEIGSAAVTLIADELNLRNVNVKGS